MFVAGSKELHHYVATRLSPRPDLWLANPVSARSRVQGTVYRMRPELVFVDLDPHWNPTGLSLSRSVTEACPTAHLVLVHGEGLPEGDRVMQESKESGWSVLVRRRTDTGAQLLAAVESGLSGVTWIDPALTAVSKYGNRVAVQREAGLATAENASSPVNAGDGAHDTAGTNDAERAEIEAVMKRARSGMQ